MFGTAAFVEHPGGSVDHSPVVLKVALIATAAARHEDSSSIKMVSSPQTIELRSDIRYEPYVGVAVGAAVGWCVVGELLGDVDGTDDTVTDGALLGVLLGSSDGADDAVALGILVGELLGGAVGTALCVLLGSADGAVLGALLGSVLGSGVAGTPHTGAYSGFAAPGNVLNQTKWW